jgi:hypothetical protein
MKKDQPYWLVFFEAYLEKKRRNFAVISVCYFILRFILKQLKDFLEIM